MGQKIDSCLEKCNVGCDYIGGNQTNNYYNTTMLQEPEREFVVTHNANIKPVSYFTGREEELQKLHKMIEEGRKSILVSGMGGIGKTQICRKLFDEYRIKNDMGEGGKTQNYKKIFNKFKVKNSKGAKEPFSHIGYIEYDRDMDSSLQNCLKFKEQDDPEKNKEAAWRELEYLAADGKLLLFVDNVNVSAASDPGLGRLKNIPGAIVLTSRRASFGKEFEPYRIGFLNTEQCIVIYERIRYEDSGKKVPKDEQQDLKYVIDTLAAGHTITVEFLAHQSKTKHWTSKELRNELESKGFQLKYRDEEDKLINIQEEYEKLYDLSVLTGAEQNILEAFSVFPYIPLAAGTCNEWLLADAGVSEDEDILMGLYQKGWLQFDVNQECYSMHPVFAQFIYGKCKPKLESHHGLIKACQKSLEIPESGSVLECLNFIPFADNITTKVEMGKVKERAEFISAFANLLGYIAKYEQAEKMYKESIEIYKSTNGENDPDTATSYYNLARVYEKLGKYSEAEALYIKSLNIRKQVFGENNLDVAASYNKLAIVYESKGEYKKAEELYKKCLKIRESSLGESDPDTADSYHNLAVVYGGMERYREAEKLLKKSIQIREKVLEKNHPDIACSYQNLAAVYRYQGELEKAEELYEISFRIYKEHFGENHPSVIVHYQCH